MNPSTGDVAVANFRFGEHAGYGRNQVGDGKRQCRLPQTTRAELAAANADAVIDADQNRSHDGGEYQRPLDDVPLEGGSNHISNGRTHEPIMFETQIYSYRAV